MGKLFHPATKTRRHEGKNKKQYLCVLVTLWQIIIGYFSGLSGYGTGEFKDETLDVLLQGCISNNIGIYGSGATLAP